MLRGEAEHGLLDGRELGREVGDPHALVLELPQAVVDEDHHLVAEPRLDVGGGDGPERPDELVDEIVRSADVPTVFAEDPQLHEPEVRVAEDVRLGAPELPVEDAALEVVDLRLLPDPRKRLDDVPDDRRVDAREGVAVRSVDVGEDLAVPIEDGGLVLTDDDVVVQPDVARDAPHHVGTLVDVLPVDRGRPEETAAFRGNRCVRDHRSISSLLPQVRRNPDPSMTCTRALNAWSSWLTWPRAVATSSETAAGFAPVAIDGSGAIVWLTWSAACTNP